ncbi:Nif11-like leader peptide family RiPP precursor [Aerosakkonema funiforme]|uniref:Nif11-like leader peptide family RiPP precursor n=1 Tax=Aerosakkonema funiforme TaxID=1246630 RepID=UPI0035B8A4A5
MLQEPIQPINAEDLPPEEFHFVKTQQAIYNFCMEIDRDEELKSQLETAANPQAFFEIAAEKGYEFSASDLQVAMGWALQKTQLNSDEFDDYELGEEELEMVAGGTLKARAMSVNSYWHSTGIVVDDQCFHLIYQSKTDRDFMTRIVKFMDKWELLSNGDVKASDTDGIYNGETSYMLTDLVYDGSTVGKTLDFSDLTKWQIDF